VNCVNLLPVYIDTCLPILVDLLFNKMALIFLGVLIVFIVSSFEFQQALPSLLMMSGPNSPIFNPLDYQVWGQCWSLNRSCNRNQNQFPSFNIVL